MKEKVLLKHPEGKRGVRISKAKYDTIKPIIVNALKSKSEMTLADIERLLEKQLKGKFDGSIGWHMEWVKLDLEARKVIKRIPKTRPQHYTLVK
jgi:hypothetical protein